MTEDLLRFRPEFPILESTTYMMSNSLGAMPRGVEDSLRHYADTWNTRETVATTFVTGDLPKGG
jgi:kynureninase